MRYQGAGSSLINPLELLSPMESFEKHHVKFSFARGYDPFDLKKDQKYFQEAMTLAKNYETVILFLELDELTEMEGFDRSNMRLPDNQIALIEALAKEGKKIIAVFSGGASIEVPFIGSLDAFLNMGLAGQMAGEAMYQLLFGQVSPSGKLAETWVKEYENVPFNKEYSCSRQEFYKEGIFVGYRYYLSHPELVRFPFGYGLSYTQFKYSDLETELKEDKIIVSYKIKNTGKMEASEVSQVYFSKKDSRTYRPLRELKGFDKTFLQPNEEKTIQIEVPIEILKYYETNLHKFVLEDGRYDIQIGSSSIDIKLTTSLTLQGEKIVNPLIVTSYKNVDLDSLSDEEFKIIYQNKEYPEVVNLLEHPEEVVIDDYHGFWGTLVKNIIYSISRKPIKKAKRIKDRTKRNNTIKDAYFFYRSIANSCVRFLYMSGSSTISKNTALGLGYLCNGHFFHGLKLIMTKEKQIPFPDDEK